VEIIKNRRSWKDGPYTFREMICQEYSNCKFSAGAVKGHPVDTVYLMAEKDGKITTQLLLRPDEMAAIAWVAIGVVWSYTEKSAWTPLRRLKRFLIKFQIRLFPRKTLYKR